MRTNCHWVSIIKDIPTEGSFVFAVNKDTKNLNEMYISGWWYEEENCINERKNGEGMKYAFTHWLYPSSIQYG